MFDNTKELLQELALLERECADLSKENATLKEQLNALEEESQHAQRVKRVSRGRWKLHAVYKSDDIFEKGFYVVSCTKCHHFVGKTVTVFGSFDYKYCPYCGALMEAGLNEK